MPTDPVILVGAGGHAKVVLDALSRAEPAIQVIVADQSPARAGSRILGHAVDAPFDLSTVRGKRFHVAIGANAVRERITRELIEAGGEPLTIVHPQASVSPHAHLGAGVFVAAQAVVAPDARVGAGTIINHGAIVDHDCDIGAFVHVAPQASLAGGVRVGARVLLGAGVNVLPGCAIGADAIAAAGALVRDDVPAGAMWAGVPARFKKQVSEA